MSTVHSIALDRIGGLSKPSKMPGHSFSLPALEACPTGAKLAHVPGTPCADCYACKGRYGFDNVKQAQRRRFALINSPTWVADMVAAIGATGDRHFRWHDSGDVQDVAHLARIVTIALLMPDVSFWLPTQERGIVKAYLRTYGSFPHNLCVRISAAKIGGKASNVHGLPTSGVNSGFGHTCPAPKQGGMCGTCRACWDKGVAHVTYKLH